MARRLATLSLLASLPACASAQSASVATTHPDPTRIAATEPEPEVTAAGGPVSTAGFFRSRKDSLNWAWARRLADRSKGYRIVVSLLDRRLWVIRGDDTLRTAPAAVASRSTLDFNGRTWTFDTPRGVRHVLSKAANPYWIPPRWHYAEVAKTYGLKLRVMPAHGRVKLKDGRYLAVRDSLVVVEDDSTYAPLPTDEEVVFDSTVFIPPPNTKNRTVAGELGKYRLDLGDGYYLHGTPDLESIGTAATHGCVRLGDDDIEWLYDNVPVGTKVYIY